MKERTRRSGLSGRKLSRSASSISGNDEAQRLKVEKLEQAAAIVVNELPEIVAAMVEKAKAGSYLHAKCAFDLARISEIELPKGSESEPWVEELLSALRALPDPTQPVAAS